MLPRMDSSVKAQRCRNRSNFGNVRGGEENGPTAFGKAGGDSRHWAAAAFPEKDRRPCENSPSHGHGRLLLNGGAGRKYF